MKQGFWGALPWARSPLALASALALTAGLGGCGQLKLPAGAAATGPVPTALVEVAIPGYAPIVSGMPELKLHNQANPKAQPPAFSENPLLRLACSPAALDGSPENLVFSPALRERLNKLFAFGHENERLRQVWNFELDRAEAQDRLMNGPAGARRNVRADAAPRPRTAAEAAARPPAAAPATVANEGAGVRQTFKPTPSIRYPTAPGQQARANAEREALARANVQLAHNLSLLKAQDEALVQREQQLAQGLAEVLREQLLGWQALPARSVTPQRLAAFDQFRTQQVHHCARARGRLNEASTALLQAQDEAFAAWAVRTVEGNRPAFLALLKPAATSEALASTIATAFPSPLMLKVAQTEPEFNRQLQQRRNELLAAENLARQQQQRLAAAEAERVAKEEKRQLLDKQKRNAAPVADEIARVLAERSHGLSSQVPFSNTKRSSPTGYELHRTVLGYTWKAAEYSFGVEAVACKAAKGGQLCSYKENALLREFPIDMGGASRQSTDSVQRSHLFRWTENGLVAEDGLKVAHLVWKPGSGGGDNSAASGDRVMDYERMNRSNYMERKSSGEVRGLYDSTRRY